MKKLTRLWRALERVPGFLAVSECWKTECGEEFDLIRPFLRPTDTLVATYPCPSRSSGECPRKIIDHGGGEFVAICREPKKICSDVSLTIGEALLHELDLHAFLDPVLQAASIRGETPKARSHGVWSIGLSNRRGTLNQPAFLLVFWGAEAFLSAARDLLLDISGQFVIVAPTNRHRNVDLQERLQARGVGYLCLQEQVLWDNRSGFSAVDPLESADKARATPVADRKRVVREFQEKHRCKVADIQDAAGVDPSDYYKWLKGAHPDHYSTCIAIEKVLVAGLPKRPARTAS